MPDLVSRLEFALPRAASGRGAAICAPAAGIRLVAERLLRQEWFLEDITGLDVAEGVALNYHFAHWQSPERVVVRVMLPHDGPECPTIEDVYPGAAWHERETADFFGVVFTGAKNDTPLLLHERLDPPPLRKPPAARLSVNLLWPGSERVADALAHPLLEELMSAPEPKDPPGEDKA